MLWSCCKNHQVKICSLGMKVSDYIVTAVLLGFKSDNIYKHFVNDNMYGVTSLINCSVPSKVIAFQAVQSFNKVRYSSQFLN